MTRHQDATQWVAVIEACDEIAARIPEADPGAWLAQSRLEDLREAAVAARAAAVAGLEQAVS